MTFKDIPAWFWMVMIALVAVPISFSIFKNGVKARFENKILGKAELDADNDSRPEDKPEEIKPEEVAK